MGINFWPEGHPPDSAINAPDAPLPHVEVYVGDVRQFGVSSEVFYFDAEGVVDPGGADCEESSLLPSATVVGDAARQEGAAGLLCELDSDGVIWRWTTPDGTATVAVGSDSEFAAMVALRSAGSHLDYNPEICTLRPPPG